MLLWVVNDLLTALGDDNISVLLLLGLSAAFDTIDHQILLSGLDTAFDIRTTWFQSYLSERTQFVSVNNSSSPPPPLLYRVVRVGSFSLCSFTLLLSLTSPLNTLSTISVLLMTLSFKHVLHLINSNDTTHTLEHVLTTSRHSGWRRVTSIWMTTRPKFCFSLLPRIQTQLPSRLQSLSALVTLLLLAARNLGFIFHPKLSMKNHTIKVCQTAYLEFKRIGYIRQYLSENATKTLVISSILSRLDYCNWLLVGAPDSVQKLKTLQQDSFWSPPLSAIYKIPLVAHILCYYVVIYIYIYISIKKKKTSLFQSIKFYD